MSTSIIRAGCAIRTPRRAKESREFAERFRPARPLPLLARADVSAGPRVSVGRSQAMSGPRLVVCVLALFAFALLVPAAWADEKVVDGCKVVKVEDGRLFITDAKGNMHSAQVASDAKITVGSKDVKLAD